MKRSAILLTLGLLCLVAQAIPADPRPKTITQPDGTTITVKLHGDEFFHYTTTLDGYTVVKDKRGFYTYAQPDGDRIIASGRIARDEAHRSLADRAALASTPKHLTDQAMKRSGTQMRQRRQSAMRRVGDDPLMDYGRFRGLIILINYTDKKFTMSEPGQFYNDMVNTHDYTGYTLDSTRVNMTGSVRDYFYDNSNHIFDPQFDIVGPYDLHYNSKFPQASNNASPLFMAALAAADGDVNYRDYDSDGDGYVDMVFFLVAGYAANYIGNNEYYLWPHMYYLYEAPARDGVHFARYACSTEIAGWENSDYQDVNGIGTFCHEFSHVLGLPDLYDTDGGGSGGECITPGEWSIMAGGSGQDFGRNPVGYSLYERYALGFTTPDVINDKGEFTLEALDKSNYGLRLNTHNRDEFFLIENRQPGKWDRFLPGHGMMIARVDSSDTDIWWYNNVNCNPNRPFYELLRAQYSGNDSPYDPFPGLAGVTEINNFTTPNLRTWNSFFSDYSITDITERDRLITFKVQEDNYFDTAIEDFESIPAMSETNMQDVQGVFTNWDFTKCAVIAPNLEGRCNGKQAVGMKKPSSITTSKPLPVIAHAVTFTFYNPTSQEAKVRLSYSQDRGETWINPDNGTLVAKKQSVESLFVDLPTDAPIMLKFTEIAGKDKVNCYLDDIKIYYKGEWPAEPLVGDVNGDGEVSIADINAIIEILLNGDGTNMNADVNGDGEISIGDVNKIIDIILNITDVP